MKNSIRAFLALALLVYVSPAWSATICDLLTAGNICTLDDGATVQQISPQSTGSGVINPFVRINPGGSTDTEQGYNTSGRPVAFDENTSPTFTHNLSLSQVPIVTIGQTDYYQFLLDINQSNPDMLSLNSIQIYVSDTGSQTTDMVNTLGTLVYNLDRLQDWEIQMDYQLNSGSGSGDMFLNVPVSLFNTVLGAGQVCESQDCFIYLYSQFGNPPGTYPSNDGFEEWAVVGTQSGGPQGKIPEPSTLVLLGTGLMMLGGFGRKYLRK